MPIPLTPQARRAGVEVLEIIDRAIETGFLAPAPDEKACAWCDFRPVCGPTDERRVSRSSRRSRSPICSRCGGSHERRLAARRCRPTATLIRNGLDAHARRRSRRRAPARRPSWSQRILNVLATRPRAHRADRRRHLHREGGRRAEAAPPQGAREPRQRATDAAVQRATSRTRSSTSRKRTSARFTASAPTCCASGRSRRASTRCSRCSPSRGAERIFDEAFRTLAARPARGSAGRRAPRAAAQRLVARRPRRRRRPGRPAPARRRASWPSGATSTARGGAIRSIATPSCSACSRSVHELAALTARADVACAIRCISTRAPSAS